VHAQVQTAKVARCSRARGPTGSAVAKSKLATITGGIRLGDSHGPVGEVASYVVEFSGIDVLTEASMTISLTLKSMCATRGAWCE